MTALQAIGFGLPARAADTWRRGASRIQEGLRRVPPWLRRRRAEWFLAAVILVAVALMAILLTSTTPQWH